MMQSRRFSGRVVTGRGEAAGFTRLGWVREWFREHFGIDPYPGTLNLSVDDEDARAGWHAVRSCGGTVIVPPDAAWCDARAYAVRVQDRVPAAIVVPDVPEYPASQVELIAAVPLRETLAVGDGVRVTVEASEPLRAGAVIFDVDGTLVDSLTAYRVVAERAAAPRGIAISDAIVRDALNTTRLFWDAALPAEYPDRAAVMTALSRDAARLWPAVLREHGRVFPAAGPVLRALADRGARLAIVTGSRRGSLEALNAAGLLDLFEAIVTGEQVTRRKPDPEGLTLCASALGIAPGEAVYVGDTPLDVAAAHAAGMRAVGILTGAGDSALLSAAGADRLVAAHERLLDLVKLPERTRS